MAIHNWITAISQLTGRCFQSRKLENNTYLKRREHNAVAVRLHGTDVVTYHEDGRVDINTGGWNTVTTKDRINRYWSGRVWSESGYMFASTTGWNGSDVVGFNQTAYVTAKGKLVGDCSGAEQREKIRIERCERNRPRNRARYWLNKVRGFSVDRSGCTASRYECGSRSRWRRRTIAQHIGETLACGCKVLSTPPQFRGTVSDILAEENQTVRVAKMRCYGIERFFLDAKSEVIDQRAGYELLALPLTGTRISMQNSWNRMLALKMTCTTTGAVYINPVPQHCTDVPSALDWIFDTKDYLGTIGQQA